MHTNVSLGSLSQSRQRLVREMQQMNFGRFEGLVVRDGEPALDPPFTKLRDHKFASENGPRPQLATTDFLLKREVVELFEHFDELQNGVIDVLEVKHGLPFRMIVREVSA